jgi:hypothetical protein
MKSLSVLAAVALLSFAAPALASPRVEVVFVDRDQFTDASPRSVLINERERDAALELLRRHLHALGTRHLGDTDHLKVEILDVDLAGEIEPWRSHARDVRVLRHATVPRIHLRYTLTRAGVASSGEERLAGLTYLAQASQCRTGEPLCYERLLLDRWFASRVVGEVAQRPR